MKHIKKILTAISSFVLMLFLLGLLTRAVFGEFLVSSAVEHNDVDKLKFLMNAGVSPDVNDADIGVTPLMEASCLKNTDILDVLIKYGADVNATDQSQETPLFYASRCGNIETIKRLISEGADIHQVNYKGETALKIMNEKDITALEKSLNIQIE